MTTESRFPDTLKRVLASGDKLYGFGKTGLFCTYEMTTTTEPTAGSVPITLDSGALAEIEAITAERMPGVSLTETIEMIVEEWIDSHRRGDEPPPIDDFVERRKAIMARSAERKSAKRRKNGKQAKFAGCVPIALESRVRAEIEAINAKHMPGATLSETIEVLLEDWLDCHRRGDVPSPERFELVLDAETKAVTRELIRKRGWPDNPDSYARALRHVIKDDLARARPSTTKSTKRRKNGNRHLAKFASELGFENVAAYESAVFTQATLRPGVERDPEPAIFRTESASESVSGRKPLTASKALNLGEARALEAICRHEGINVRLFIRQAVLAGVAQCLEDSEWAEETRTFILGDGGRRQLDDALTECGNKLALITQPKPKEKAS